ncbi:MAG: C39 family peptidase [Planctomycetales bacterium]|nr:C39 family peptidase [Planctomycetales bacterium]
MYKYLTIYFFVLCISPQLYAQTGRAPTRDGNRSFSRSVLSWRETKLQNVVLQQRDYSCGAAAMATVLKYYWGKDIGELEILEALERTLKPEALKDRVENGLTMADMKIVADRMGYDAAVGKLDDVSKLAESKIPVIVAIQVERDLSHFVAVRGCANGYVYLADPFLGNLRMNSAEFARIWIDNAIFVVTLPGKTSSAVSRLGLTPKELLQGRLNDQVVRRQLSH